MVFEEYSMKNVLVVVFLLIGFSSSAFAGLSKSDGVVTDSVSSLEWQDDYTDNSGSVKQSNWVDAIAYCENLTLNLQSDWRLPNRNELLSIADFSTYSYAISSVFENLGDTSIGAEDYVSANYWSSTADPVDNLIWVVNFYDGLSAVSLSQDSPSPYVRCVRAGQ